MSESEKEQRRREYPRVKESCEVSFRVVDDAAGRPEDEGAKAVNISGGGMCFRSHRMLTPGSMVALRMALEGLPSPVVALARVVWCEQQPDSDDQYDVGVEFWWIGWAEAESQKAMLTYINGKLKDLGVDASGDHD